MRHNILDAVDQPITVLFDPRSGPSMADDRDAEIEALKLKIDNLLVAAHYRGLPQAATVAYLKELQVLRQRLQALSGNED